MFKTIDANRYDMMVVNEHFLDADLFKLNVTAAGDRGGMERKLDSVRTEQQWFVENYGGPNVTRLSNRECIRTYGINFVSGYAGNSFYI